MDAINERFALIRKVQNVNVKQFALSLDMAPTTVSSIELGKREPSKDVLLKLALKFGVNLHWMLTGEGEMLSQAGGAAAPIAVLGKGAVNLATNPVARQFNNLPDRMKEVSSESTSDLPETLALTSPPGEIQDISRFRKIASGYPTDITVYKFRKGSTEPMPINEPDPEGVVFIPIYSQRAAAGPGQDATQLEETESLMPIVFEVLGAHKPEHCAIVRVTGDSMTDITLNNGDWAIFDNHDLRGDGLFVISMFGEMRVKRLQYRLTDRKIIIASENQKRYPDPEVVPVDILDRGDLRIFGRVFSWIHKHPY